MIASRRALPSAERFLADAGLETWLVYHRGITLRAFAAYELLWTAEGRQALHDYYRSFLELARSRGTGLVLESPTWRANPDWGRRLGHGPEDLHRANRDGVALLQALRAEAGGEGVLVSGCLGPRHDGYRVDAVMDPAAAERYHVAQVASFLVAGADLVSAMTMTTWQEAAGIVRAARHAGLPVAISFTVETDGRLPSGQPLGEAITTVDRATDGYASHFMVNCAHPTHFARVLETDEPWVARLAGIRANASRCSHAELDAMEQLDDGDPQELADRYRELVARHPQLRVLGGCCGTDLRHIAAIADRCAG